MLEIDEVFPIDLDLDNNINQSNLRLRPEYVKIFTKQNSDKISHLSSGSLSYAMEDEEGEKEDLNVAKATQHLKLQYIVRFVEKLDSLSCIPEDSKDLSRILKENGINMRYLGKIIKITKLPYIRIMAEVEAIARCIRNLYREYQKDFLNSFRNNETVSELIREAYSNRTITSMKKIRLNQLKEEEEKASKVNVIDFLNLIFGVSQEFEPFWNIIRESVQKAYDF